MKSFKAPTVESMRFVVRNAEEQLAKFESKKMEKDTKKWQEKLARKHNALAKLEQETSI